MSDTEIIFLPESKFKKNEASISRVVGIEQNINVSKLKNGNIALSMREGKKQIIFDFGVDVCMQLITILKQKSND